jgi:hypothetical protein
MTHPILLTSFGVSLVLTVADKLPEFDIAASCKEVAGFGLAFQYNPESCMADEKEAHNGHCHVNRKFADQMNHGRNGSRCDGRLAPR